MGAIRSAGGESGRATVSCERVRRAPASPTLPIYGRIRVISTWRKRPQRDGRTGRRGGVTREAAGSVGRQRTQTSGRVRPRSGQRQRCCCDCCKIWALAAARQPCARSAGAMACPRPSRRHSAYATSHRGRGIHGGVTLIPRHHTHRISLHESTATSNQSQKAAQTPVRRVDEAWSSELGAPRQLAVGHQCTSRGGKIRAKVYRRESTLKLGPWVTKHSYRKGTIGPP
jgi:hypothetical protein